MVDGEMMSKDAWHFGEAKNRGAACRSFSGPGSWLPPSSICTGYLHPRSEWLDFFSVLQSEACADTLAHSYLRTHKTTHNGNGCSGSRCSGCFTHKRI